MSCTWDPNAKGVRIILSNNNLTASWSYSSSGWGAVRSTLSHNSGKHYAEFIIYKNGMDASGWSCFGVGSENANLEKMIGDDIYGFGWRDYIPVVDHSYKYTNSIPIDVAVPYYRSGSIIGILYDADIGKVSWSDDGVPGPYFTGLSGNYYIIWSTYSMVPDWPVHVCVANFDGPFSHLPTGAIAWGTPPGWGQKIIGIPPSSISKVGGISRSSISKIYGK